MDGRVQDRMRYEQAAQWLLKVQAEGAPPELFAEMLAWCDADPANKLAMEKIEEAWAISGEARVEPALTQASRVTYERVSRWMRQRFGSHGGLLVAGSMAALVLAAIVAAVALSDMLERGAATSDRIATSRGAHDSAKLADGSTVELGGKSSVSVVFSPLSRVVVAEDGEAFYRVVKDPARPFVVRAGPVTVTAVGTAFSVRRTGDSVSVVVTEGEVDVRADAAASAVRVSAGQLVRYDRGAMTRSDSVAAEVATSWRDGRLQFVDEPLRLVIASVNRYSPRELLISDPSIEELRFTGTVFEKGVDSWLHGVEAVFPVRVVEIDHRRVMLTPASDRN